MKIYLPEFDEIIEAEEGSGCNLTQEDIDAGYVDYVYYTIYDISDLQDVEEVDGGMMLLTVPFSEAYSIDGLFKCTDWHRLADDVVKFAKGDCEFTVL